MRGFALRIAAVLAGAAAAAAVGYFHAVPTPDALASLAWGNVLAEGVRPGLAGPALPVPHPLPIIVGALLSLGGPVFAVDATSALAGVAWAGLAYAVARLTFAIARAHDAPRAAVVVAVAVAAVLALRPSTIYLSAGAIVDVPYAALIVFAGALVAEKADRSPTLPLALLALAGLIRPEAWVIGGAYVLWRRRAGMAPAQGRKAVALALAPAVLWLGFDAVIAGDPLHTLDQTDGGQTEISGPRFNPLDPGSELTDPKWIRGWGEPLDDALLGAPSLLGTPLLVLGLAGGAWALLRLRRREPAGPETVALGIVVATLGALGVEKLAGVPVDDRYALPAAAALAALGAAWLVARGTRGMVIPAAAVLLLGAWAETPKQLKSDRGLLRSYELVGVQLDALEEILDVGTVHHAIDRCGRVVVGGRGRQLAVQGRSIVALHLDRDYDRVELTRAPRTTGGASVLRVRLPKGPLPRIVRRKWEFRSKCLPGGRDRGPIDASRGRG